MTNFETDVLAQLIRRKHECLRQLLEMGGKQVELVRSGSMTELLDVLSAKQRVLDRLVQIEGALAPFRDQDPEGRQWRSSDERRECAEKLDQCESMLAGIVAQEKQSEHELTRRRDEAATRLQGAHLAGQARGAYTALPGAEIRQLDLSSGK